VAAGDGFTASPSSLIKRCHDVKRDVARNYAVQR
jgi:hypothetical protein